MELQIPINKLKFGQDDGGGINARVTGRTDGIDSLAANINARGLIEPLVVKQCDGGFYSVSNGNRRLAAFHLMFGTESDQAIKCTLREVDEAGAFEDSLTTAVLAQQLHPVDQYEAFAKLEYGGKTDDEIGLQYGMTKKQVKQVLALGSLSPKIRNAWRGGDIKKEVAQAFTLAPDVATQERVFDKLLAEARLFESRVKSELGADATDHHIAGLLTFVGADAYRARGGTVAEDLFGTSHIVEDPALLKSLADELLAAKCQELIDAGWSWASVRADLPHGANSWQRSHPKDKELVYEGDEQQRIDALRKELDALGEGDDWDFDTEERLDAECSALESIVRSRSYTDRAKKKSGCILDIDDGKLDITYGVIKPAGVKATASAAIGDDEHDAPTSAAKTSAKSPAAPDITQALLHRLSLQLTKATATALVQDEQLALSVLLAGIECRGETGVRISVSGLGSQTDRALLGASDIARAVPLALDLKPAERVTLLAQVAANALDFQNRTLDLKPSVGSNAICNAILPSVMNAALRGAFDAKDYFAGVNKAMCLKAIEEALGKDVARQQANNPKGEIEKFALINVAPTGWLPVQLRVKGYDGPPVKTAPVKASAKSKPIAKQAATKKSPAKKTAKKTAAKKTTKKKK